MTQLDHHVKIWNRLYGVADHHVTVWNRWCGKPAHRDILDTPQGRAVMANILASVQPQISVAGVDLQILRTDLNMAVTMGYEVPISLGVTGVADDKHAIDAIRKARKGAEQIQAALANPASRDKLMRHAAAVPDFNTALPDDRSIKALIKIMDLALSERPLAKPNKGGRSAFDYFVGVSLVSLFKKHFQRDSKFSRDNDGGKAYGAFIRFAESVLDAFEINAPGGSPYKPEAIAYAARTGRSDKRRSGK